MSEAYTTAEIHQLHERFATLAKDFDDLVKNVLDGIVMVGELEAPGVTLNLLLNEARQAFESNARFMIGGDLDLYSEAGLAKARKTYNEVLRYREMVSWIMAGIKQATNAAEDMPSVENMMRNVE